MIGTLIHLIIYIIILGVIWWLLDYLISALPVPEPFAKVARILLVVVAVLIIVMLLLNLVGGLGSLSLR